MARWRVPLALVGIGFALGRAKARTKWVPPIVFAGAFFYVVGTHYPVFARYALPLIPMLSLFTALAVVELIRLARRVPVLSGRWASFAFAVAVIVVVLLPAVRGTAGWLDDQKHPDTRAIAADWLRKNTPAGARVAVENSGPTYLTAAGLRIVPTELLLDHPADWYRARADYLIVSSSDLSRYGDYLTEGTAVFQIAPTPQRWGPPITILRIVGAGGSRRQ